MNQRSWRFAACAMGIICPIAALAQNSDATLGSVVVTGERVQAESAAQPYQLIDADELNRRSSATIGETLRGLPGISATGFGSNSSRPVVRGQDGERVKILQNSAPTSDLSAMSYDHAVGIQPFALEQAEMLRGPAALLYGGNPLGGVVNLVDRRIMRSRIEGTLRSIDARIDSSNLNRQAAFELESAVDRDVFMHVDGFAQRNEDTRTPRFTDNGSVPVTGTRVRNTAADASGVGLGLSRVHASGFWGVSLENSRSEYGVPKEVFTTIRMDRSRLALAADQQVDAGVIERIRVRAGLSDYQHRELDRGATESTFTNRANDLRIEMPHRMLGGWKGLVGFQWEYADVDVASVERSPLQPRTKSPKTGMFMFEERTFGAGTVKLGARLEQANVKASHTFGVASYGSVGAAGSVATDGAGQTRSFAPASVSAEYGWALSAATRLSASASHAQRAPSSSELFALGVHHASGLFEVGHPELGNEKGNHLDLTLLHAEGNQRFKGSVFYSRYSNYITLIRRDASSASGTFYHQHEPGSVDAFPVYDYAGVEARFHGVELEYKTKLKWVGWQLSPGVVYDRVIGKRVSNDAYIPRLTPQRLTPFAELASGPWTLRGELQLVDRAKLGEHEIFQAPGYALLNVYAERRQGQQSWFFKGSNLTNRLAYNANTVDEIRQYAPLAGRAVQAGTRWYF